MLLTVALLGPAGHEESIAVDAQGGNLGALLGQYAPSVAVGLINGRLVSEWQDYIPQKNDRVRLALKIQEPISSTIGAILGTVVATVGTTVITVGTIVSYVAMMALSMAIGQIVKALTPNPKAPKLPAEGQAFGITGFTNTTGQGVPIPVWYGEQRVWGHVISSGAELSADNRTMVANILYCLGDTGGDEYELISDVLIDRIPANQYQGVVVHTRSGALDQTIIPHFDRSGNLFAVGRTLDYDDVNERGTAQSYITTGNNVNVIKLILQFPAGLWRVPDSGQFQSDFIDLLIELKKESDTDDKYVVVPSVTGYYWHIQDAVRSAFFRTIWVQTSMMSLASAGQYWIDRPDVKEDAYHGSSPMAAFQHWLQSGQFEGSIWHDELAAADQWELRITIVNAHTGKIADAHATTCVIFNVEEQSFTATNYPGYALLGIVGLQGNQVKNLQSVEVSAFVKGKKCKNVLIPGSPLAYTRERTQIVRDLMTHPTVGMGYEFSESEIDDAQWHFESLAYYDEMVASQDGGLEQRDVCDVGITERRWDWDWVKRVASEGRACVIPSGLKWKYVVDKPGTPNLLLAEPGNVIEGSISMEISPPDDPFNQIVGQFRDSASDYTSELSQPIDSIAPRTSINQKVVAYETITRESEVLRENMIQMKRQDLEKRRFSLVSPSSQLLGEPFDIDWLCERSIGDIGAYTGVLPAGCTLGTLNLPYTIDLDVDKNYLAIIQHKGMTLCETRQLINPATGRWGQVALATALDHVPEEGDIFAIGEQTVDHIMTRARDFQIDDQGRITQIRTEYIPAVYDPDPLPPGLNRKRFPLSLIPPIPIREATVTCQLVQRLDGSWGGVILFDITPGLAVHAGHTTQPAGTSEPIAGAFDISATVLWLGANEPRQVEQLNYYKGAYLMIVDGPYRDMERKIIFYDSPTRAAVCEPFPGTPLEISTNIPTGTTYRIRWTQFSETYGFKIEQSTDRMHWVEVARPVGMHYERDGGDQGGTWYHRFTPYNQSGVFNEMAPLVRDPITFFGDTTPPTAPASVQAWGYLMSATIQATFTLPTSLDLAAIEAEIWKFDWIGDPLFRGNLVGYANARAGTNAAFVGQTSNVRMVFDLSNNPPPYTANLYARVRSIDYSGNISGWVQSNDFFLHQINSGDVA